MEDLARQQFNALKQHCENFGLQFQPENDGFTVSFGKKKIHFRPAGPWLVSESWRLPIPQLAHHPQKIAGILASRLGANRKVFARKCTVAQVPKTPAREFLDLYHLMGSTASGYNYGLYFNGELMALASFSKGRKMKRLPPDQRSFELIRFASKAGITVIGGLSRLISHFIEEKHPGDIMTYVDLDFSDGEALKRIGFEVAGKTPRKLIAFSLAETGDGPPFKTPGSPVLENSGNLKLILRP